MVADRISDFITHIKNAGAIGKESVAMPHTTLLENIANVLKKEGYVADVDTKGKGIKKDLVVTLAYEGEKPKVTDAKRVSKLSLRKYLGAKDIRPVRNGYGILVLSTPEGILTGGDAQKKGVGGEALFQIW